MAKTQEKATGEFVIRRIPLEIRTKARQRTLADGLSLNDVLLRLLAYYADHGLPAKP